MPLYLSLVFDVEGTKVMIEETLFTISALMSFTVMLSLKVLQSFRVVAHQVNINLGAITCLPRKGDHKLCCIDLMFDYLRNPLQHPWICGCCHSLLQSKLLAPREWGFSHSLMLVLLLSCITILKRTWNLGTPCQCLGYLLTFPSLHPRIFSLTETWCDAWLLA